jgi:pimeloyl-ACP methyl ester carboxylesterase
MNDPINRCGPTLLALVLLAAGCSRHEAGKGPAASGPPVGSAAGSGSAADRSYGEGPRITISPDNVHIEYRVYGHGEPAVLLVHGWACDENYWHAQLDALKARYTVVTLNLAGHGASGANRSDWSMANYAQDVAAVARALPNPQLVLVGHSMGAAVTLAATPLIGERVIGVVAVEALRSVGQPPLTPRDIEQRVAPFDADFVGATRNLVTSSLFEPGADAALAALDGSDGPAAGDTRAGVRHQLRHAADRCRAHPPLITGFPSRRAESHRPLPDVGRPAALQCAAVTGPRPHQPARRSLSELIGVRRHRAAAHLEPIEPEGDALRVHLRPGGGERAPGPLLLQQQQQRIAIAGEWPVAAVEGQLE